MSNPYCESLQIAVPVVDQVVQRRLVTGGKPSVFMLLVATLLEHGQPMTLEQIAERLQAAGVGPAAMVLGSLKKSRPARSPVYRDGGRYGVDERDILRARLATTVH